MASLGLWLAASPAFGSFAPRPWSHFASEEVAGAPRLRDYHHQESHRLSDGTELDLQWKVRVAPESILSLDTEPLRGVRILNCGEHSVTLLVPSDRIDEMKKWLYIVASQAGPRHACKHLPMERVRDVRGNDMHLADHLYQRILSVRSSTQTSGSYEVVLITEPLHSPSDIITDIDVSFTYWPPDIAAKRRGTLTSDRRLEVDSSHNTYAAHATNPHFQGTSKSTGNMEFKSEFSGGSVQRAPNQLQLFGWNWDVDKHTTKNPEVTFHFPKGYGYALFKEPYLRLHGGVIFNFTSHFQSLTQPPEVHLVAEIEFRAAMNADMSTLMDVSDDWEEDPLNRFRIPFLSDNETTYLPSLAFWLGNIPVNFSLGMKLGLEMYHLGKFKGTSRFTMATEMDIKSVLEFDTKTGVNAKFSVEAQNTKLMPPTWLIFTKHFEMGLELTPEVWLRGCVGSVRNAEVGVALRPYINVSVLEEGAYDHQDGLALRPVAIFPFRAIGLPPGEAWAVQICAQGHCEVTDMEFSTGIVEWADQIAKFTFGDISEPALMGLAIEVALMKSGEELALAKSTVYCQAVVNGECQPSPLNAILEINDQGETRNVAVQVAVVWQLQPVAWLTEKVRSISVAMPTLALDQANSNSLSAQAAELRFVRNGHDFVFPLVINRTNPDMVLLQTSETLELGACFLDTWRDRAQGLVGVTGVELLTPKLELFLDGRIVAENEMPPIPWDSTGIFDPMRSGTPHFDENGWGAEWTGNIPVDIAVLTVGTDVPSAYGTGQLQVNVADSIDAAFFIHPSEATQENAAAAFNLVWSIPSDEGTVISFAISIWEYNAQTSHFEPVPWSATVESSCQYDESIISQYHNYANPCTFQHEIPPAGEEATGNIVSYVLKWELGGVTHQMSSAPVVFAQAASRRLRGRELQQMQWNGDSSSHGNPYQQAVGSLSQLCQAKDLEYAFGYGILFKGLVRNVRLPSDMPVLGGLEQLPLYDTGFVPITSKDVETKLDELLPATACAGGMCQGKLPGCPETHMAPVVIPRIKFTLSRKFHYTKNTTESMRSIIAYGLASLPELLTLMDPDEESTTPLSGRRLESKRETDTVILRIDGFMPITVTQPLMDFLVHHNKFQGISDGREKTHGPVHVLSARMLADDLASRQPSITSWPLRALVACFVSGVVLLGVFCIAHRRGGYQSIQEPIE